MRAINRAGAIATDFATQDGGIIVRNRHVTKTLAFTAVVLANFLSWTISQSAAAAEPKTLDVLFIGNSYTARHNLSQLVKAMSEAGDPAVQFEVETVIYGGRRLVDHWRLGTQNVVNISRLTAAEEEATIQTLEEMAAKDPSDKHARAAIVRHRQLLASLDSQPPRKNWDIVVLQSYRDDLEGDQSLYSRYAPKFAELIKSQGGRVVLYETTPTTQNAQPLTDPPDREPVIQKARSIAALAQRIDATVVPMSMVALRCQTERPDLTLRFVNDAHLNQTLAYLTACTFYGALFDRSSVGLPIDSVTDIRYLDDKHKDLDRDGDPLKRTFSDKDRADLQRIAWEGLKEFRAIAASAGHAPEK